MPPKYDGTDTFTISANSTEAQFFGKLSGGVFSSNNPVTTTHPVTMTINVPLISGGTPLALTLNGGHVKFQTKGCAADDMGKTPKYCGEIHGSILNGSIQNTIIPAVAKLLTTRIQADPNSAASMQIKSIFDTGGCTNPASGCDGCNGMMATASDGTIDVCEVSQNGLIMQLLAPDIQVFNPACTAATAATCTYGPQMKATMKDSMSVGLGFEATDAMY
jgi:hypothetical protein